MNNLTQMTAMFKYGHLLRSIVKVFTNWPSVFRDNDKYDVVGGGVGVDGVNMYTCIIAPPL